MSKSEGGSPANAPSSHESTKAAGSVADVVHPIENEDADGNNQNIVKVRVTNTGTHLITPGTRSATKQNRDTDLSSQSVILPAFKKELFKEDNVAVIVPHKGAKRPHPHDDDEQDGDENKPLKRPRNPDSPVKRRLFGRSVEVTEMEIKRNVRQVYRIIKQRTGSIGGNGCFGPIYGELTMGSMQRIINMMKQLTNFNSSSRFIDVGSGIGKPNLHVLQDPGVELSYGIEVEESRWMLGLNCLQGVLDVAHDQQEKDIIVSNEEEKISSNCIFQLGDITNAKKFDPFTHVYMFSIGFPPTLWIQLADIWNRSLSPYLVCYHSPRDIIECYEFNVELIAQLSTSMHGSKESHMGYIYGRKPMNKYFDIQKSTFGIPCDPYYKPALDMVGKGLSSLKNEVDNQVKESMGKSPAASRRLRKG